MPPVSPARSVSSRIRSLYFAVKLRRFGTAVNSADPIAADPKGEWFTFEKGASKTSGGEGWADVWRKECFAWEYKGKRKDLDRAFAQLQKYAIALDNPPLLIVSDMERIRIHTNWTNTVHQVHDIRLADLTDVAIALSSDLVMVLKSVMSVTPLMGRTARPVTRR